MDKPHIDELYPNFKDLVCSICYKFVHKTPGEELEDLTQTCWEHIVRKYPDFSPAKSALSTWVTLVAKSAMYDLLKAIQADKRAIRYHQFSLDAMTNGHDKYL